MRPEAVTPVKAGMRPEPVAVPRPLVAPPDFTIITGLSGAGRSEAARCLEDLGYFVVDNLPPALVGKMAELAAADGGPRRVAIVADVRGGGFFPDLSRALHDLRAIEVPYRILFLEASDEVLLNRFAATRRRHPIGDADGRADGIRRERAMMASLRGDADLIIDTSALTPQELRDRIRDVFARSDGKARLQVSVVSFGYKHGVPRDADLVLDARFLPNPYWVDALRPLAGTEEPVRRYVAGQRVYGEFVHRLRDLLDFLVPGYVGEGKAYLTVAVGCTGGRHRSVVVAEELARHLRERGLRVASEHRDVDRG